MQRGDLDLKKDRKASELALAANRVSEIDLSWDPAILDELDVDLTKFWNENEISALLKDFRTTDLSAPLPKLEQAGKLQKKWKTKRGQIWVAGDHRIMCGDSLSEADVTALMDGKIAKLCATDPPYLVSYDANNHPSRGFSGKNKVSAKRTPSCERRCRIAMLRHDQAKQTNQEDMGEVAKAGFRAGA